MLGLLLGLLLALAIAALLALPQPWAAAPVAGRTPDQTLAQSLPAHSPALALAQFPLGFYYVDYDLEPHDEAVLSGQLAAVQAMAEAGFNTVHLAVYDDLEGSQAVLDRAQALGLRVIVDYQSDLSRSEVVHRLKGSPGILGWAIGDDVNQTLTPAQLRVAGAEVKAADGDRPTYISMFDPNPAVIRPYLGTADWVGMQSYPVGDRPLNATFSEIHSAVETAQAAQAASGELAPTPVLANLQAFAWPGSEPGQVQRLPSVAEVRNMTFQALAAGAEGILYYSYRDADSYLPAQAELWQGLAALVPEVEAIAPWLRGGGRTARKLDGDLILASWEGDASGKQGIARDPLLMVINTGHDPLAVELDLGDWPGEGAIAAVLPPPLSPARLQSAPRPSPLQLRPDGHLVGTLAPLDVHLYQRQR